MCAVFIVIETLCGLYQRMDYKRTRGDSGASGGLFRSRRTPTLLLLHLRLQFQELQYQIPQEVSKVLLESLKDSLDFCQM